MKQLMHKEGIFFTSIAFLITTVLVLTFGTSRTVTMTDQLTTLEAMADAANTQAIELKESYLPQSVYVAAYNSLYAMSEYMRLKGEYFTGLDAQLNFNNTLKEMVINGTMCCGLAGHTPCDSNVAGDVNDPSKHEGVDQCIGQALMNGKNLTQRLIQMENASLNELRITTVFDKDYSKMHLTVFQDNTTGPWQVGINLTFNYTITAGDVSISNAKNISVIFDITGIPDPLYGIESQRTAQDGNVLYTNYFNATNMTTWNISNLYHEIEWRLYKYDGNGSSFLGRFYGSNGPSACCGVESIINPLTMPTVNGNVEKPYVDWCYYTPPSQQERCATAGQLWNITCITKDVDDGTKFYRFALGTYHALMYNISNSSLLYQAETPAPDCPAVPFP